MFDKFPQDKNIKNYRECRGDKLDSVYELLGFDKKEQSDDTVKSFIERSGSDDIQEAAKNYVQSTSFITDIICKSRGSFFNKLLRVKYSDKMEQLLLKGPLMQNWK